MFHVCTEYIYGIYSVNTIYMYSISDVYTNYKQCSIYNEYAWYIPSISQTDLYIHGMYMVYTMYIEGIWCPNTYVWYIPCKI